ncbi:MAG: glycosyltransferase family 2 protein [Oscillospiraceae bacterium]|nr:glycosyltransferase family 2 protein [Oscillospiraceae bacterium]
MADTLYLVIPCYNEEEVLPETIRRLTDKMGRMMEKGLISDKSRMAFVDDGSHDGTWALIEQAHEKNPLVSGVRLAHNRGHQNALLAGLMTVAQRCDMAISLDADLQDDVEVLDQFVEQYQQGCDIVYGVRSSRKTDTAFKRSTALAFYRVMEKMGVEIVYNHADYRLMSRRALEALGEYREVNLFLRGMVPNIGFRTGTVEYERSERFAGESKYPLKKMLSFAWDGVTSFSVKPLQMVTALGVLVCALSLGGMLAALICLFCGLPGESWPWILCSVWLAAGVQLVCLGVVGAYIGKIYKEVKARPRYLVETFLDR